jgi:hypothetical protein
MKETIITRRDFLRVAAGTAMAATLGPGIVGEARAEPTAKVVLIRNAGVLGAGSLAEAHQEFGCGGD